MSIMEQNNIEEQVCDAIGILVNEGVKSAGYDKTISAQIVECVDTLKGKYKIKYQDAYYYATSDNIEVEYTKNTQVYILVPGNDFSKEKKIVGTVKDLGDTYISTWNAENEYMVVGRNCAEIVAEEPLGLCSYKSGNYTLEELILYKKGASNNKLKIETTELKKYLEDSEKLRIGATFQTALADEQRQRGNYGISVKANFKDADNTGAIISKTFNLDVNNMIGMPYSFEIPSAQYLDFDIQGSNFIEITQVALLIADFPVEKDNYPKDIFISNFVIEGLAKPDAKVFTTYYLNITSSTGRYLTETDSKTTLEAILSLKNKTITSSSLEYYWFIEDASVVTTHDSYCVYGGQGWRCLNDQRTITEEITKPNGEVETKKRNEWIPGSAIREVKRENISNIKSIYKCVCIYNNGKSSIAAEIELENTNPNYKFVMESTNGTEFILDRGKTTLKLLDNKIESEDKTPSTDLTYHWAKEDSSGGYHYLGSDHTGNGGELPVCEQFDNSTLMNHLRQLQMNYDTYLGNKLVATKSVYSEYSTFDAEKEEDRSVLKEGFDNSEPKKAKNTIINLIKVLGFENKSPTNQELADAIQPYLDSISITYIDESTFYDIPARSILNYNIFKCTVMNGKTVLGTARIKLTNRHVSNDNGYIIIENGNQTFKYSAEGVAPTNKNNKNHLTLKPLTFKLYDEKGTEVTGIKDADITWYYPLENTLIKGDDEDEKSADGLWGICHEQTFVFDIENRFKYGASNNVIKIEVKYQDRILKQDTSFSFIKDGMSGTNGTDYFCRIVPKYDLDNAYPTIVYNKKNGSIFLNKPNYTLKNGDNDNKDWFFVELWNCGTLITENVSNPIFSILHTGLIGDQYSVLEINKNNEINKFSFNSHNVAKLEAQTDHGNGFLNILRAEVEYQGKKYYAELPIALAVIEGNIGNYGIYIKPQTGYNEVVYAADGARPLYANSYPFETQVILYEGNEEIDLSNLSQNSNYRTPLKYDYYTLEKNQYLQYANKNNKYLTISKLKETIKNDNGTIQTIEIEGPKREVIPSPYYNGDVSDLGLRCIVKNKNGNLLGTLYFPIHFMLNKYGYSALNDWDGKSIDINKDGGYILSPQIGAGKKDTNNCFTGVLMGEMKSGHDADSDIGLLGFSAGDRTIFLDAETGKAEFGRAGAGQIIIDPGDPTKEREGQDAIIRGGSYSTTDKTGMEINFGLDPYIKYGSGNFEVNPEGILTAKGANFEGHIESGSGEIGGWNITKTRIWKSYIKDDITYYNSFNTYATEEGNSNPWDNAICIGSKDENSTVFTNSDGTKNANFVVSHDGILEARGANIAGTLKAGAGSKIGPWTVSDTAIYKGDDNAYKSNKEGSIYFGNLGLSFSNKFYIDASSSKATFIDRGNFSQGDNDGNTEQNTLLALQDKENYRYATYIKPNKIVFKDNVDGYNFKGGTLSYYGGISAAEVDKEDDNIGVNKKTVANVNYFYFSKPLKLPFSDSLSKEGLKDGVWGNAWYSIKGKEGIPLITQSYMNRHKINGQEFNGYVLSLGPSYTHGTQKMSNGDYGYRQTVVRGINVHLMASGGKDRGGYLNINGNDIRINGSNSLTFKSGSKSITLSDILSNINQIDTINTKIANINKRIDALEKTNKNDKASS